MRDYSLFLSTHKIISLTLFKMLCFGAATVEQTLCLASHDFTLLLPKHLEKRWSPFGDVLIRSWGFVIWFRQDEIRVGHSCSLCTLRTPAQYKSSQKLSPGVSPAFPPSFSAQTHSCKSKWKLQLLRSQSVPKELPLPCPVAFFPRFFSLGWCLLLHGTIYSFSHCVTIRCSELCDCLQLQDCLSP